MTFLFTDIEGSTRLLRALGPERYAEALAGHRRVLRDAFVAEGGVEVDTQGDAFFVAFPTATGAAAAALGSTEALASGPMPGRSTSIESRSVMATRPLPCGRGSVAVAPFRHLTHTG